jgi:hypothetical protein
MDRDLTRSERLWLRCHLLLCNACRRYSRQVLVIRLALRQLTATVDEAIAPRHRLSAEATERIRLALRSLP